MKNNPIYDAIRDAKNNGITGKAIELADALNAEMAEMTSLGHPKAKREAAYAEKKTKMSTVLFELATTEIKRLEGVIAADRKQSLNLAAASTHARAAKLELERNRLSAMSNDEILSALQSQSQREFLSDDPSMVDALFARARASRLDQADVEAHRSIVIEKRYDRPWLNNPDTRQREKEIRAYSNTKNDEFVVVSADGSTTGIELEDLLDGPEGSND